MYLLNEQVATIAVNLAVQELEGLYAMGVANKFAGHFVILDPLTGKILHERSINEDSWGETFYHLIARGKAALCWEHEMDSDEIQRQLPHLLDDGDCIYGGGVYVKRLVVAFSGVQAHIDTLLARNTANRLIALSEELRYRILYPNGMPKAACGPFLPKEVPTFQPVTTQI